MIKRIKLILIVVLIASCNNNNFIKPEKPDNLISEEKMVDVLYDMALMSAAKGVNRKIMEAKGVDPQEFIYEKHNIDSLQFALSNTYYSYNLKTYDQFYARVKAKLNKDKDNFNALIDAEKKEKDSLNRLKRNRTLDTVNNKVDSLSKIVDKKKLDDGAIKEIDLLKKEN
jgi:hypothetical protein